MESEARTSIKNILFDWFESAWDSISAGFCVNTAPVLCKFERTIQQELVRLGGLLMSFMLLMVTQNNEFQKQAYALQKTSLPVAFENHCYLTTPIRTLFGNIVQAKIPYFKPKEERGKGFFPVLEQLGIHDGVTPALSSDIAREVTEGPSMESTRSRLERRGIDVGVKTVQRISEVVGQRALSIRDEWVSSGGSQANPLIPEGESFEGKRIAISVDGGRLQTRETKRGKRRKSGFHGYDTEWIEPKILVIRAMDSKGKVDRKDLPIYDGTLGDADALFGLLELHLKVRHIELAREIEALGDGAPWIWNRMEPMLVALGVDMKKVSFAVDFYHAVEHLAEIAGEPKSWKKRARKGWLNKRKSELREGKVDKVIPAIKAMAKGRNAGVYTTAVAYFTENRDRMRYDRLKRKHLPIGSGIVESAIRQIINLRLKGAGIFWIKKNAEAFVHLRSYLMAGRWDLLENAVISRPSWVVA